MSKMVTYSVSGDGRIFTAGVSRKVHQLASGENVMAHTCLQRPFTKGRPVICETRGVAAGSLPNAK